MQKFPGGPVVKTLSFHCRGRRFHPWSANMIPHAVLHSQKKKARQLKECILFCVCSILWTQVFNGPKTCFSNLKFDDLHSQQKAGHAHDLSASAVLGVGRQPSDKFTSVNLLPGGFSKRVPQAAASLGLFLALLYRLLSLFCNLGQQKTERAEKDKRVAGEVK